MFGFEPNDNLSISPNLLTHPDDLPGVLSELAEVVKNPDYVPVLRYRFFGKDGNYRWIESTFSNMLENAAVEAIVINFRDIHERVLAEEELMSQKYFFEQMFTQSSVSTQILDKDGWCEKVNPKLSELFGVKAEDIENHKYNIFKDASIINNGIDTILKKVFEEGGTTDWEVKFDIGQAAESQNITVESPKVAWYYNWAYPLLDKDGKLSKVIIQHHETTSRKATEQALIQAKEKAEESDRLKSAFLANMSHEIRTPMNGILGFAELLKEPNLTGEQQQDYIRIIKKSGDRMLNIINDIIDISKIESGQMVVSLSQVNIREQLEDIYQFFKPETDSKGIAFQLDYQIPEQLSDIETDREKLFAIYINLVKNAIKFTNKGYIKIRIYLNEGQLESCVEDTGIGVEPDRQEAIFERFIQADIHDKHAKQGAGLGLAISKAYIEMLGGKIWMDSRVGAGSNFFFKLPLKNVRQLSNDESKKLAATAEHSKMSHLKVLVAEDDETSDLLLTLSIKDICREVIHAVNGNQAVELCRLHHDFDLIFMDIKMPDIDGYEATRQIRQFNKDVIIIAQTAYALTGDEEKSLNAGCNAHITKPLTREKLFRLISDLMRE
jgi:PAS domain S-box-containing protein